MFVPHNLTASTEFREPWLRHSSVLAGKFLRSAALSIILASAALPGTAVASEREYAAAVQQYRNGRFADAYGRFLVLADRGDADAARVVLFMYRFGPSLYGAHWDAHQEDIAFWTQLANKEGRPHPAFRPDAYFQQGPKAKATPRLIAR